MGWIASSPNAEAETLLNSFLSSQSSFEVNIPIDYFVPLGTYSVTGYYQTSLNSTVEGSTAIVMDRLSSIEFTSFQHAEYDYREEISLGFDYEFKRSEGHSIKFVSTLAFASH